MGKARKGKKSWRKNISTKDIDELIERTGREERSGVAELQAATNESLFFVDKSGDATVQRKVDKHRNKVLHVDSVLQRSSLVPPVPSAVPKRRLKDRDFAKPPSKTGPTVPTKQTKDGSNKRVFEDVWADDVKRKKKAKVMSTPVPNVPAVEVDVPGCSYNPTFEDHQDALGIAVAQEMQLIYKKELEPEPLPEKVPGTAIDEEDAFFLEADDEEPRHNEDDSETTGAPRPVKMKKLTRVELNKKARRRQVLKEEAEKQRLAKLDEEIRRVSEIQNEIHEEDEEKQKVHTRRTVSRKERLESCPPKLGKHKFKPEPMQVLLSEEVTGSLRKLKGCYSLLRDRYKSFQRRGILEPRVPIKKKSSRKMWVSYQPGSKGEKERASHAAMQLRKEAAKQALVPLATAF